MITVRKRGVTALTAAAALAIGVIPAAFTTSSILASGEGTTTLAPGAASIGKMVVSATSAGGSVSFNGTTESFAGGQQCQIMPAMDAASSKLLNITGSIGGDPGTAGLRDGFIGVYESDPEGDGPQNASQCFRVDANSFTTEESLTLRLDADLSDRFGQWFATAATANPVAQSRDGELVITLLGASSAADVELKPVKWFRAKSGDRIPLPAITGKFYGIRLKSTAGSFSLTGPSAATFDVSSEADKIFCPTNTYTDPEGGATVEYLGGGDGSCFGITLTSGAESVRFLKPLDVNTKAQFVFDHVWTLDFPGSPELNLPVTVIDFELPGGSGVAHDMDWCPDVVYDDNGQLGLVTEAEAKANFTDWEPDTKTDDEGNVIPIPGAEDIQFACVGNTRKAEVIPPSATDTDGALKITDRIYLIGDAAVRFR